MDTKKLIEILDKNINQEALAKDLAAELVIPFLEKFVADSANPYDDKLVDWIKDYLAKQVAA